jgi:hypothetical protein
MTILPVSRLITSFRAIALALFGLPLLASAQTANDHARFLAGLPVRDTPLAAVAAEHAWAEHATEFDSAWRDLEKRQLSKIRDWSGTFLGDAASAADPVFYFYSGPDALYALTFFPNAANYILCGLEPVGAIPDVAKLPRGALAPALQTLRKALNSALSFSFFITKEMKSDLNNAQLSGTLPVLYVFLARAGCKIDSVELVGLDKTGAMGAEKPATRGVKICFFGPSGHRQTLFYFASDLSNEGMKTSPAVTRFCESFGQGRSLLKAASYLMHLESFSMSRDFLLAHSKLIVTDDSGIPFRAFDTKRWTLRLFGAYRGPIDLFKKHAQPDLAALYTSSQPAPLGFSFGYQWHPASSTLILATERMPKSE